MLIFSKPSIPDRTDYILGKSEENPVHDMIDVGNLLADMGADHIAIPCITAHYFNDLLAEEINTPIINAIKETARYLKDRNISCAGIMATEGTIYSRLFQEELVSYGVKAVVPSELRQKDVTDLIYKNVKANKPVEIDKFFAVSRELKQEGAQVIILGCTELSIIKRDFNIGPGYIDAMEVLAMRSIQLCGARLKEDFMSLITK
jgi:aspartate racemase